ncbi:short-chain dehydrogenase/reductase [Xylaria sp. FL0933]|nr:short-chain dehydrogenase/reductase [Xylaria sp. FL0933]
MPKSVLITGCGPPGIGNALALEFHLRGHRVFASGLSEDLLAPVKDLQIETFVLDVTSTSSINSAVTHISSATGGKLDILINNAGVMHVMPFADTDVAEARQLFEVNVLGVFAVTKAFLPLLLAASAKGDGSRPLVANIGSVNQVLRPAFLGIYNASKAAVETLGGTIRNELAPLGVRVVIVKTGSVHSSLFDNTPLKRLPDDSLYRPIREFIEGREMLRSARFIDADAYAKKVVTELLRPSVKPVIWAGGLTTIAWLLSWFGWEGMLDGLYIKKNHLDKIRR